MCFSKGENHSKIAKHITPPLYTTARWDGLKVCYKAEIIKIWSYRCKIVDSNKQSKYSCACCPSPDSHVQYRNVLLSWNMPFILLQLTADLWLGFFRHASVKWCCLNRELLCLSLPSQPCQAVYPEGGLAHWKTCSCQTYLLKRAGVTWGMAKTKKSSVVLLQHDLFASRCSDWNKQPWYKKRKLI